MAGKIDRSAFLYMDPKPPREEFAQCGTCGAFIEDKERCYWHGKSVVVDEDDSCGLYAHGKPMKDAEPTGAVTPEVSGLVDAEVRCEHCRFAEPGVKHCGLYRALNKLLPAVFKLDIEINRDGCCNAWLPKERGAKAVSPAAAIIAAAK